MTRLFAIFIVASMAVWTVGDAVAQSNICSRLDRQLRSLDSNRDYRNYQQNVARARAGSEELKAMESEFVRRGYQRQLNSGQRLNRQGRALARTIQRARSDVARLVTRANRGAGVARTREDILQEIARFGCRTGSSVTQRTERPRGGLLEQLFDRLGLRGRDNIIENDLDGFFGTSTLRTVCVRRTDGYYWPVSFSTLSEYLGQDAQLCQSQCPAADVDLYYYRNPGEGPEDMVNLSGQRYADTATAFNYRTEFTAEFSCRRKPDLGTIEFASAVDGPGAATVTFNNITFPLPRRDPRRTSVSVQMVQALVIPLPRLRPNREGEPEVPVVPVVLSADLRLGEFGDKVVRIVGPETPYVPQGGEGS
ncbi:MAG: DUF2865 domain-containing protein [Alphaproteobacteria bacterium]|nr:DUF2865 domain-containing protein [Alphaproteobacteria bacterium]